MSKLTDVLQHWLQGEINSCVAGHQSRIDHLEQRIEALAHVIDCQSRLIEGQHEALKELYERVTSLETSNERSTAYLRVKAMLEPESMCADDLLKKICESEKWRDVLNDIYSDSAFVDAVNDAVTDRDLRSMVRAIINDLNFDVSVR